MCIRLILVVAVLATSMFCETASAESGQGLSTDLSSVFIALDADRRSVTAGESVQLSWATSGARRCRARRGWNGWQPLEGLYRTPPLFEQTVFKLICRGHDGSKAIAVSNEPPPTPIETESVEPSTVVAEAVSSNRAEMNDLEEEISSQAQTTAVAANNLLDEFGDDAWAIQLIALQSRDEVEGFVARYEIQDPKYVQIESGGANWYVLILDVFADRASADSAAQAWETENEPSSRPWVRQVRSLKAAARRAES